VLKDGPDLALFAHPAMLTRLATWLTDALRDSIDASAETLSLPQAGDAPLSMPFVVAALDASAHTYLVVGVSGATDFGDVRRNRFGLAFQEAAQKSGARTEHDRFETTVVEVAAPHLSNFIEALHVRA
ncbi:CDC45-like protein, partial [Tilletiaria anomala UBC 951]